MIDNPFTYRPPEADESSAISFYRVVQVKGYRYKRRRKIIRVPAYFYLVWIVQFPGKPREKVRTPPLWIKAWKAEIMERRLREKEFRVSEIGGHFQHTHRFKDWFHLKDKFIYHRRGLPLRLQLGLARVWFWVLSTAGDRKEWHYKLWVRTFSTARRGYTPRYQEMKHHIIDEEMPAVIEDLEERFDYLEVTGIAAWSAWAVMQKIPYHKSRHA